MAITTRSLNEKVTKEFKQDKVKTKVTIEQSYNGFFVIKWGKGSTPQKLSGKYSSIKNAEKALERYFRTVKPTLKAKSEQWKEESNDTTTEQKDSSNS